MSRLDLSQRSVLDARPSTRATTRKTEKTSHASPIKLPRLETRSRLTAEQFAKSFQQSQAKEEHTFNIIGQRGHQDVAPEEPSIRSSLLPASVRYEKDDDVSASSHHVQQKYKTNPHEMFYNPSRTQLLRDADTFHHFRIRSVARDAVDRWCYAALQAKDYHEHLERLAAAHDTEILLRQAFEHWRLRLHTKKQIAATERYFQHEEQRITKARNVMLLGKAFTHWTQVASDERVRAIDSRQKVLSMKYFQAWRDITIANQHSVRYQGLRKFFTIWKKRYTRNLTDDVRARLLCRESSSRNAYWHWFWVFCDRRAPEWRAGRLRCKYLLHWVAIFRNLDRRDQNIRFDFEDALRRRFFSPWLQKARLIVSSQREAVAFNRGKEMACALQSLRRNWTYSPIHQQVSNMVDWRVAGATFAVFVARYRCERQAEVVDRLRRMRNAWTQWNDRLRWQTVARRIGDRYCLEALYRWVVSERYNLLQRLSTEQLKQRFLYRLKNKCAERQSQHSQNLQLGQNAHRTRLVRQYLLRWRSRLDFAHQNERIAFEFNAPKLAEDVLQSWKQRYFQMQENRDIEKHAYPYFASKRFFRRWHAALHESKKQKRRNAYKLVRREQKMALARGILEQWRGLSAHTYQIQKQADRVNQERLLNFGTTLFDQWRSQADSIRDKNDQARQHYERRLLERHLYTWIEGLEDRSRREEMAEVHDDMRVQNVAFGWLNKLRLKIIELKGQEANAENLRNWYEKRHFRSILRQWHNATANNPNPQNPTAFSSRAIRRRPRAVVDEEAISRAEDWTDFDVGDWIPALEAQSSTTPLPGYLSTPSKRAARARSMIKTSTTPAGTPFEQRLRAQMGLTPRTTRRSGFGRSTTAIKGSTFGAILEDSPRTPNTRN